MKGLLSGYCIEMNNLGYNEEGIAALWDLIKDSKRLDWAQPPGIRTVKFLNSFLGEFEEKHRKEASETWKRIETVVTTDLDEAIRIISNSRIVFHRLSCQAYEGIGDYTVLFINCIERGTYKRYSVVIPGLNYIYPS